MKSPHLKSRTGKIHGATSRQTSAIANSSMMLWLAILDRRLVDVGGGTGTALSLLVKTFPWIRGINFDLPHVVAVVPKSGSIENVGGDMFMSIPNTDVVFLMISSKDESRFVMHDLINDLAQVVAEDTCSKLEGNMQQKFSNCTRHSSYIVIDYDTVKKFEAFDQVNSLRAFLPLKMSF
ncbi:hypothetical protein J1N35_017578 [Gossypium stocksii]|uniref:O-methyltransferase C-terminal domain-containing protein n=1 Tax=Gossypium stocksii TaxID=47602 RepID=A0A9D3VMD0_9ROSI|nr:hypothetical protein J1N35_017578 [Gossypium stocksii]